MPYRPVPVGVAILVSTCVVSAVVSPFLGVRLVLVFGLTTGAGSVLFPWYYNALLLAIDLYPLRVVARCAVLAITWTFAVSLVAALMDLLPAASLYRDEHAYHAVLGPVPLLMYEAIGAMAICSILAVLLAWKVPFQSRLLRYYVLPLVILSLHTVITYGARFLPNYDVGVVMVLIRDRLLFAALYQVPCAVAMAFFARMIDDVDQERTGPVLSVLTRWLQ